MSTITEKAIITVGAEIKAPVEKVWTLWTDPKHIICWNFASEDWHTPKAENDLRVGGKFNWRMEAKDGSLGFDFTGKYSKVEQYKEIEYTLDDDRKVKISFISKGNGIMISETFEAEQTNTVELQHKGWQAILNNFKKYVEASGKSEVMHFEIHINARVERVYLTMIEEKQFSEWTAEFNPTSHYKGSWEKDSKILFLGTNKDGGIGGMVSKIKENIPNEFICIEHLGIIQNGKEVMSGSEVDLWAGILESYTFIDENGTTLLYVDMESQHEISEEFKTYLTETWPKALKKLKALCEH